MKLMRMTLALAAALVAVGALSVTGGAATHGTTQVDGAMRVVDIGDPFDVTDDVTQVRGDLIGYWWTTRFDLGVATSSGVVTGSGTERFDRPPSRDGFLKASVPKIFQAFLGRVAKR